MTNHQHPKEEKDLETNAYFPARLLQAAEYPPTGAPKESLLARLADEALAKGRPVLVIPLDAADPEADSPGVEDYEPEHEMKLPKNTTVVFSGRGGFPSSPSKMPAQLEKALGAAGRARKVRGGFSYHDVKYLASAKGKPPREGLCEE